MGKENHSQAEKDILEYIELGDEIKHLKEKQDKLKKSFTAFLDSVGAAKVTDTNFVATKSTRKGSVNVKDLCIDYGIMDSQLEKYRGKDVVSWTVRKR